MRLGKWLTWGPIDLGAEFTIGDLEIPAFRLDFWPEPFRGIVEEEEMR